MQIFSQIVLGEWLRSFLKTFFVLFTIVFVGNIVSEFLRDAASVEDIFQNFILEVPQWMGKVVPISCLGASLFSIYKLKMTNALISLFSLGQTRKDFVLVIVSAAFFVVLIEFFIGGYIHPLSRILRKDWIQKSSHFRGHKKGGLRTRTMSSGLIWYKSKNYFAHFSYYDRAMKKLNKLSIFYFSKNGLLNKIIRADSAEHFKGETWRAVKVVIYSFMDKKRFPEIKRFDDFLLTLSEDPSNFENIESDVHELDVWELKKYVQKVEKLGIDASEFKVLFYEKFSTPLICFIFSVMPLSGIFNPSRRGHSIGKTVIFLVVFTFAFWFMYSSTLTLGSNGKMTPIVGAFGVPVICLIYVLIMAMKNRNLTE